MSENKNSSGSARVIREISYHLVKNHLRASLELSEWRECVIPGALDDLVERRVIAVIGSGASKSVGLPLAAEALKSLKEEAVMPPRALDAELDRLSQIYKLERDAFETHLRALSTSAFDAQQLRDNLQKMYRHRYLPVLGYEILAHMLKHRFLDAIINFNFDELLDQAIEDELDRGEYHHILSDGDCPDDSELRDHDPELPFYIKPHGTASHKSTLRFTREDYYGLPFDIQRVLRYLLTDKPVVLLVIGFGMQSLEFNHILEDAKRGSMLFHINPTNPTRKMIFERFKINKVFKSNRLLKVDKKRADHFSVILKDIWNHIALTFKKEYRPREITRHIMISKVFFRDIRENNIENYLRGRTVIELCLSIAKGKGLVTLSQLSEDRSGKYFDLFKGFNSEANLYEMCRQIGLKDIGYSREALRLMKEEKIISNILTKEEFDQQIEFLYRSVQDSLDQSSRSKLSEVMFRDTLLELYDGLEVELRYSPYNPYTKIFKDPKPIPTHTAMKLYTKGMFKREWKYLFVVAETGQWLVEKSVADQILKNAKARIFLVVADRSWEHAIRKKYGRKIVEVRKLPWWQHNRHITILADDRTPLSSIYFSRRLRSANITPVLLENADDTLAVLESFNAYWIKAATVKEKWITASDSKSFSGLFESETHRHKKK